MTLIWKGDFETGDLKQWGGVEYGGTFDGTPSLSEQISVVQEDNGLQPLTGKYFAKITVPPGAQYGGSTGWRCLIRTHPDNAMEMMGDGYDSTWVYAVAVPVDYPPNPGQNLWVAGLEMHHSNGVNGAPSTVLFDSGSIFFQVAGGVLGSRTVSIKQSFLPGYPKMKWVVFVERYKHDPVNGAATLYAGVQGDNDLTLVATKTGIPTQYQPLNGSKVFNYALFGLYLDQVGTKATSIYLDHCTEWQQEDEALAFARTLLGGSPPPLPTPTTPDVLTPARLALAELRASDDYKKRKLQATWTATHLYKSEQAMVATIKAAGG